MMRRNILYVLLLCLISNVSFSRQPGSGGSAPKLLNPVLVNKFYNLCQQRVMWYDPSPTARDIRAEFLRMIDSAEYYGLGRERYHYPEISGNYNPKDSTELLKADRIFTDAVIAYYKDVFQGANIPKWIKNDEISRKYVKADDDHILDGVLKIRNANGLGTLVASLEPHEREYAAIKDELRKQILSGNKHKSTALACTINLYRWMHHFNFNKFIVVNIPSATLRYYEADILKLQMKVVVGKPSTRSPRFSTWCNQVVLYPYWNVPRSIAVKELLPKFKRSPAAIDAMDLQVVGKNGRVIDHHGIDWSIYNSSNLPYTFRQCTGCDNALGVIKFNLTDPFDVYMHDTNYKLAFLSKSRFFSHGCIRVEKPIELGNYLLNNTLDSAYLKACLRDQKPVPTNLKNPVPVFVVYMTAETAEDTVVYHKDVYRLFH